MIGYLIQQELDNVLSPEKPVASLLTWVLVNPHDPAFANPTKFVGPVYDGAEADKIARIRNWEFRQDGAH